jgi:hypothetical protein
MKSLLIFLVSWVLLACGGGGGGGAAPEAGTPQGQTTAAVAPLSPVANIPPSQLPVSYASTQMIVSYMATLHSQSMTTFAANENALGSRLSAQGAFSSGTHYSQSGVDFVAVIQRFANDSLAFVNLKSQTMPIDKIAVAEIFSTYAAQDAAYANTYYRGVSWGLTSASLTAFVADINKKTNDLYALIVLQLP